MNDTLTGLWGWVWTENDPERVVDDAIEAGFDGLLVKAWNGETGQAPDGFSFIAQYSRMRAAAARPDRPPDESLLIVPWTYVYGPKFGNDPVEESTTFARAIMLEAPEVPLLVVDMEAEYGGLSVAQQKLFESLQMLVPGRVGCNTWDLPELHPEMAIANFQRHVDSWLPMVYWDEREIRGAPAIERSRQQYAALGIDERSVFPAVQGYNSVTTEELVGASSVLSTGMSIYRHGILTEDALAAVRVITWEAPDDDCEERLAKSRSMVEELQAEVTRLNELKQADLEIAANMTRFLNDVIDKIQKSALALGRAEADVKMIKQWGDQQFGGRG